MDVVVACDERGGIAFEDKLPWHLPEDLAFFRDITKDQVIIMGHRTYEAMPKSISHERTSIVFSRRERQGSQVHFVTTVEKCLEVAQRFWDKRICVIGGQDIFELFLDAGLVDRVYLTRVRGVYPADRFFPLDRIEGWNETCLLEREAFSVFVLNATHKLM